MIRKTTLIHVIIANGLNDVCTLVMLNTCDCSASILTLYKLVHNILSIYCENFYNNKYTIFGFALQ